MNHGVVMFHRASADTHLWHRAMGRGQFLAIYTSRSSEVCPDRRVDNPWTSAFVRSLGEPEALDPEGYGQRPGYRHPYGEIARYEPEFDLQFSTMCMHCSSYQGQQAVVLPAIASDDQAICHLVDFEAKQRDAWPYLEEKFYVLPRKNLRKPKKPSGNLAALLKSISVAQGWAYFLGFFRAGDNMVAFLSHDQSDVEALLGSCEVGHPIVRQADWLDHYGVIEKW